LSADGPKEVSVRPFCADDRPAVLGLWAEAFHSDPAHNDSDAMIDRKLRIQPDLFLVAVDRDGHIVGSVMAGYDGVRGWIHRLCVRQACRRRGVGTTLLMAAEDGLARMGCPKVNLQVRTANAGAVGFYRAVGYRRDKNVSMGKLL
jgi:ribosomal protein S18 acetylase RimI-like enzyme